MRDIVFAILGIVLFIVFCSVLISFVPQLDLVIVVSIVILMASFDFIRELVRSRKNGP